MQIAQSLLAALPPLTEEQRAAFLAQTTPQERASLGGRTRADAVLREVGPIIAELDRSTRTHGDVIRYGAPRRAFLAQITLDLSDALGKAKGQQTGASVAGAQRQAALQRGRRIFRDLFHALSQITRGHKDRAKLDAVERGNEHDDTLAGALDELVELGRAWVAKSDVASRALVEGARLTAADLEAARAASAALVTAGVGRAEAGRGRVQDPPDLNVTEGVVVAEVREAYRAIEAARDKDPSIPRLPLGSSLRTVIGGRPRGPAKPAAPAGDT